MHTKRNEPNRTLIFQVILSFFQLSIFREEGLSSNMVNGDLENGNLESRKWLFQI